MGPEAGRPEKAAMGKPVNVGVTEGYRMWASTYDRDPNPLLALEQRVAAPLLGSIKGARVIDLCAGTGRWMAIAARMRASVIGVDINLEMLAQAATKPGLAGCLVTGDLLHLPFRNASADLAICSFGLSYASSAQQAFRELARVARRVMVNDMHPTAIQAGWSRAFENASRKCRIACYRRSLAEIEGAAYAAGLRPEYSIEACFGEPERKIFEVAGKLDRFEEMSLIPAVYVKTWV
jgi:ubiquinone/menaquinone biosynthesis C-methylase UbiE